jgi:hypothetical protein
MGTEASNGQMAAEAIICRYLAFNLMISPALPGLVNVAGTAVCGSGATEPERPRQRAGLASRGQS